MIRLPRLLAGPLAWAALAGCQCQLPDTTPVPATDTGSTSWAPPAGSKEEPVPGIDFATVDWGTWGDDLVFAVWIDRDPRRVASSGRTITGEKPAPGHWEAAYRVWCDPPNVSVQCRTADGSDGWVAVNDGRPRDLSQGRLFLIATTGGEVRVKQLSRPGLWAKPGPHVTPPDVFANLKADPEVRAFFEPAKLGGKPE